MKKYSSLIIIMVTKNKETGDVIAISEVQNLVSANSIFRSE